MSFPQVKGAIKAYLDACNAILEAIKEFGPEGVPSGHIYNAVMGHMTLDTYQQIIGVLLKAGKITQQGFVLKVVAHA